jgi:type IV secretory pathway TraG/TraD family ATPase VirD4
VGPAQSIKWGQFRVAKSPAARFFEAGNEKTLLSILTTVTKALAPFQYIERGDNFSVSEWVREGKGWLFLPYNDGQIAALQAIYRTWMRLAISATMSLPEADHRLWLVIDEFDALGKIPGLKDALTRIRRFGGRVLLGTQTSALIEELYGKGFGKAITENCLNQFILRCSSSENGGTAKFASDLIGEHHIRRTLNSSSTSSGSGSSSSGSSNNQGTTFSQTEQETTEAAVSQTDISRLLDLTGYLKFATEPDWQLISYEHDCLPIIAEPFEPKGTTVS